VFVVQVADSYKNNKNRINNVEPVTSIGTSVH
jgi:hypothetical protein